MTESERLILQGLDILMRTQRWPADRDAMDAHFNKVGSDMLVWRTDHAALLALAYPVTPA